MPTQTKPRAFIAPQIPVLSAEPPTGAGWIHEINHDGFRTLLRIDGKDARAFITRGGQDWSDKYGRVKESRTRVRVLFRAESTRYAAAA